MQPISTPEASTAPPISPAIAEATCAALAAELSNYLDPLDQYSTPERLADYDTNEFRHAYQVREAIDAMLRYDVAVDALIESYRHALALAQQPAAQVPTLEQAILGQLTPAQLLAHREADPVYRLGFARGQHQALAKGEAKYQRLVSLYAQYAILVPPPGYSPSPLATRVQTLLDSPAMQQYAALPLETRQALNTLSPADLHAHVIR